MTDNDAIGERELEKLGELGRDRGDGHDGRAPANLDRALRLARGAKQCEGVALRVEREVVVVGNGAERVL